MDASGCNGRISGRAQAADWLSCQAPGAVQSCSADWHLVFAMTLAPLERAGNLLTLPYAVIGRQF